LIKSNQHLLSATYQAFLVDKKPFSIVGVVDCHYQSEQIDLNGNKVVTGCAIGLHLPKVEGDYPLTASQLAKEHPEIWALGFAKNVVLGFADAIQKIHDMAAIDFVELELIRERKIRDQREKIKQMVAVPKKTFQARELIKEARARLKDAPTSKRSYKRVGKSLKNNLKLLAREHVLKMPRGGG
jgi:hypothetical protein